MIGHISGEVLFSDGNEVVVMTPSGVGYQIFSAKIYAESSWISLFTSQVIRENSEDLYGFETLRAKKLFEMLLTVKNVGAKSAFALISHLGIETIIDAVMSENKAALKKAPGVGDKAAGQMVLDLSSKIMKIRMYENKRRSLSPSLGTPTVAPLNIAGASGWETVEDPTDIENGESSTNKERGVIIQETLLACKELGFKEDVIIPKAQKILGQTGVTRSEQLVHLVLKEM